MRRLEVSVTCVVLLERLVAGFSTGTTRFSTHQQSDGELAGLEGGVGSRLPSLARSISRLHPNLEENQAEGKDYRATECLPVKNTLGTGKSAWREQVIHGGRALPNETPRFDYQSHSSLGSHQPYSSRPAWLSKATTSRSKKYPSKVPLSKPAPVKSTPSERSIIRDSKIGGKLEQPRELSKANHPIEASLPQIWDKPTGHHAPVSLILRASAVKEFVPFLSNAYLHHLGINFQYAKPTIPEIAQLNGVVTWFRHHVSRVTESLESNGEYEEVESLYQELTDELLSHVQAALQDTFRARIPGKVYLQNQLKETIKFLKGIERRFRHPSSHAQWDHLHLACEHILSDLQNLAGQMHVEGNSFASALVNHIDPGLQEELEVLLRQLFFISKHAPKYYLKMKTVVSNSGSLALLRVQYKQMDEFLRLIENRDDTMSINNNIELSDSASFQIAHFKDIMLKEFLDEERSKPFPAHGPSHNKLVALVSGLRSLDMADVLSHMVLSKDQLRWLNIHPHPGLRPNDDSSSNMQRFHHDLVGKLEAIVKNSHQGSKNPENYQESGEEKHLLTSAINSPSESSSSIFYTPKSHFESFSPRSWADWN